MLDEDRAVVAEEIKNVERALPLVRRDGRLGFQQESNCYMFSVESMEKKLEGLARLL